MPADMKLLTYSSTELEDGLPVLLLSNCLPIKAERFEAAGFSFHAAALRYLGLDEKEDNDSETVDKKDKTPSPSVDSYFFKGKKKSGFGTEQQDHYALLGLSHLRYLATEEQIRKSYREVALKHHPDKQAAFLLLEETEAAKETKKEEIDQHFKAIQEAYEVLIDPVKRRVYDSIDEFDDGVPSECSAEDFFKVFGPVFMRNGRWSIAQPVPVLGRDDTPLSEVDKFYDFWYSFKSWREFPHADEFDLEQAESREHKRWMERQNLKLREKAKKEESSRVRALVENAYKRDPRIIRRKEEEKAEKLRKKQAKALAKKEKEEEAARVLEEERLRKEEEEKQLADEVATQKKSKEKEKKLLRKERSRLRLAVAGLVSNKQFGVSGENIDNLCLSLELEQLRCLCEKVESKAIEEQAKVIQNALGDGLKDRLHSLEFPQEKDELTTKSRGSIDAITNGNGYVGNQSFKAAALNENVEGPDESKSKMLNADEKKEKPWTKEEVELLRKAVIKYPKGTSQRWEVVANYIGTGRSVDEILRGVKTVLLQKPDSSKAFDSFLQKRKTPNVVIASPLSKRDNEDKTKQPEVVSEQPVVANGTAREPQSGSKSTIFDQNVQENAVHDCKRVQQITQVDGAHSDSTLIASVEQDAWSETQELVLVKAIKAFPKDTAQRWERIAAAVPGKTKAQCFKKFAGLRESFRNKKGGD
ncbi:hypothetical protein O6H91_11G108100 [Diphasiastrum complanatum]|uniref:Uncharacterized protein n=2 Tax=Diphasiastrum complanatum TaxID=34168 RepID=A0ACC2CCI8_DIPCM|nr:hypothetical protein O6H91_11G108100 [Diphasiastrum complanatum]